MNNDMSSHDGSGSGLKIIITVVIVVLIILGLGYYLFKISPSETQQSTNSAYNSALDTSSFKTISEPPAFDPKTDHYQGSATAKNVFIEYADYECPACAAYSEMLKQVPSAFKDTVFVLRYFPLVQIHPNSVEAALAAEAAGAQGKYWEMHDILFAKQTDWQDLSDPLDTFAQYAQSIGISNIDQFKSDVTSKKYLSVIQADSDQALGLNLPGTPSFFFNGHTLQNSDIAGMEKQAEQWYNK
jgi:protein-disulfide isomerase